MAIYHKAKPFLTSILFLFWDVIKILHIFYHRMRNRMNVAMLLQFFLYSKLSVNENLFTSSGHMY